MNLDSQIKEFCSKFPFYKRAKTLGDKMRKFTSGASFIIQPRKTKQPAGDTANIARHSSRFMHAYNVRPSAKGFLTQLSIKLVAFPLSYALTNLKFPMLNDELMIFALD